MATRRQTLATEAGRLEEADGSGVMRWAFGSLRPSWIQLHLDSLHSLWQHHGFPAHLGAGSSVTLASSWDPVAFLIAAKFLATVENSEPGEGYKQTCYMDRSHRTHPNREPSLCPEHLKPFLLCCSVIHSCLILFDLMDCSPPSSSVHGISQARILECFAVSSPCGSSQPRDRTQVSCIAGGFFTTETPGRPKALSI